MWRGVTYNVCMVVQWANSANRGRWAEHALNSVFSRRPKAECVRNELTRTSTNIHFRVQTRCVACIHRKRSVVMTAPVVLVDADRRRRRNSSSSGESRERECRRRQCAFAPFTAVCLLFSRVISKVDAASGTYLCQVWWCTGFWDFVRKNGHTDKRRWKHYPRMTAVGVGNELMLTVEILYRLIMFSTYVEILCIWHSICRIHRAVGSALDLCRPIRRLRRLDFFGSDVVNMLPVLYAQLPGLSLLPPLPSSEYCVRVCVYQKYQ